MGKDFLCAHDRVTFSEAFEERSRGVRKIKQKDYLEKGLHPVVDQGQSAIAGYSDEEDGLFADVPGIVFGDHTRCVKYIDEPFFAGADGVKILKPKLSDNTRFWYHALRATRVENLGYSRHFKLLKQSSFRVYEAAQERAISQQLDIILRQIEVAERQIESLDSLVKSQFVEMFGDPGENPMGWKTSGLTSLGSLKNGMNFKSKERGIELPCLGVGDFKDRSFIRDVADMGRVNLDAEPAEDYFLRDGDIVFVRSNGNKQLVGRCLAVYPHDEKAVYSGFCIRLRIESDKVRVPFLIWTLKQPSMRRQMFGRGANVQNLNQKLLATVSVPLPPLSEQDRFVGFVQQVDKSKAIARKQIEKLQLLYDSLAQEYFGD